jgi:hypothetical protein
MKLCEKRLNSFGAVGSGLGDRYTGNEELIDISSTILQYFFAILPTLK